MSEKKTDLRIIKTKKALEESFLSLIKEKPFESITVNELCDRALIRRATFYKHYTDKYDFLSEFIREKSAFFHEELWEAHEGNTPVDYCTKMFMKFIDFFESENFPMNSIENHLASVVYSMLTDEIYADMNAYLTHYERQKGPFPVGRDIISNFYAGGIIYLASQWYLKKTELDREQLVQEFQKMMSIFELGMASCHATSAS